MLADGFIQGREFLVGLQYLIILFLDLPIIPAFLHIGPDHDDDDQNHGQESSHQGVPECFLLLYLGIPGGQLGFLQLDLLLLFFRFVFGVHLFDGTGLFLVEKAVAGDDVNLCVFQGFPGLPQGLVGPVHGVRHIILYIHRIQFLGKFKTSEAIRNGTVQVFPPLAFRQVQRVRHRLVHAGHIAQ